MTLLEERRGHDFESLLLRLNVESGDVVLDAQDLGPLVESVFGEGNREYEWMLRSGAKTSPPCARSWA